MLDYYVEPCDAHQTNVPVLLAKLGDADHLLDEMRRMLAGTGSDGQSIHRVEEVIASLKRLRWSLESKMGDKQDGGQTEAILRFQP